MRTALWSQLVFETTACFCLLFSGLMILNIRETDFLIKQFTDCFHCIAFVETLLKRRYAQNPNQREVMKAKHDKQVPRKFTASLELSILLQNVKSFMVYLQWFPSKVFKKPPMIDIGSNYFKAKFLFGWNGGCNNAVTLLPVTHLLTERERVIVLLVQDSERFQTRQVLVPCAPPAAELVVDKNLGVVELVLLHQSVGALALEVVCEAVEGLVMRITVQLAGAWKTRTPALTSSSWRRTGLPCTLLHVGKQVTFRLSFKGARQRFNFCPGECRSKMRPNVISMKRFAKSLRNDRSRSPADRSMHGRP